MRGILEWRIVRWVSQSLREIYIIYIWPFLDEKNLCFRTKNSLMTPVFTHFLLSHSSPNTILHEILGGRIHGPPPTPTSICGGPFPYGSAYSCAYEIQIPQMTPTILCYVPQSFERLVPTTPSFQTRTHDPPHFSNQIDTSSLTGTG